MNKYYFALFFTNKNYVEKCLSLIRYISSPNSHSSLHITFRTYVKLDNRLDNVINATISHLNIIEPGTFNIEKERPPYVVYIRCESDELEEIEYKPDYPFSRLHITLYEGDDIGYAKGLFSLLKEIDWHFKFPFNNELKLIKETIGQKKQDEQYYQKFGSLLFEITGEKLSTFLQKTDNSNYKLQLVKKVVSKLCEHLKTDSEKYNKIESLYFDTFSDALRAANKEGGFYYNNQNKESIINMPTLDKIYITPPEYAKDMAKCALEVFCDDTKLIDFGDPSVGTGTLFLAIKKLVDSTNKTKNKKYKFNSAVGIDVDEKMVKEAIIRCGKRGLSVIYGDAIRPDIQLGPCRNLVLANPPYIRQEDIPLDYRLQANQLAEEQTGIKISNDAGLYVYHLLIMDKWLCRDGVAAWLIPSIFFQSKYGKAIRQYLLNNVQLIRLHVYDYIERQFENAQTSTAIVVFKKCLPIDTAKITISHGTSISNSKIIVTDRRELSEISGNWREIIFKNSGEENIDNRNSCKITFKDLFDIKRGIATGANSFFVMERSKAKELEIPDIALKPLLPKARYLKSNIIQSKEDGYPDVEKQLVLIDCDLDIETIKANFPVFFDYLQTAEKKEEGKKPIIERTLVSSRHPWYKQEIREAPPFLLTYMGRNKDDSSPLYFILNKSNAVALNTYILLYPREWLMNLLNENDSLYEKILSALNKSAEKVIVQQTRIYSGGLHKLEPGELKGLPAVDLPDEILKAFIAYCKL